MGKSNKIKIDNRYCALCHKSIPRRQVKLYICPRCHRRSYCSHTCRLQDWTQKSKPLSPGQGHADWCDLSIPEEDLDWVVGVSATGTPSGVSATRFIPNMTRILVEGYHKDESSIFLNTNTICLIRHSCQPNASLTNDEDFHAVILYSVRDIHPGEEITFNYIRYNEQYDETKDETRPGKFLKSYQDCRSCLEKVGITCSLDCVCRSPKKEVLTRMGKNVYKILQMLWSAAGNEMLKTRQDVARGLEIVRILLQNHAQIHSTWIAKERILSAGRHLALYQKGTLEIDEKFGRAIWKMRSRICHPTSHHVQEAEYLMNSPEEQKNYLCMEEQHPDSDSEISQEYIDNLCDYVSIELRDEDKKEDKDKKKTIQNEKKGKQSRRNRRRRNRRNKKMYKK